MVVFQPPEVTRAPQRDESVHGDGRGSEQSAPPGEGSDADDGADEADDDGTDKPSRRRRRRGGRGRGKSKDTEAAEAAEAAGGETDAEPKATEKAGEKATEKSAEKADGKAAEKKSSRRGKAKAKAEDASGTDDQGEQSGQPDDEADDQEDDQDAGGTRRRRRRRRRGGGGDGEDAPSDDPPNTVVHVREPRALEDEVQSVKGSTRLEAKKQRRREGREHGRRRPPIITESEFLARRESVERVMVVRRQAERTQIAVLEDDVLVEHYVDRASHQSYVGNVYLGKVQNVLPSMEAAFVDIGKGRNAVLYAGEVNWDVVGLEGQPRRIESALKSGQSVLVQVTKDPLGHKGARLTSQISLPGRYLVYVPDGSMTGISRKLPDKERNRLKQILKKVMPENAGVIVRTAAEGATEEELSRDVSRLSAQWENIQRQAKTASAPALLYGEPDLTIRVVRDVFNEDFTQLVVSGDESWETVAEYVQYVAPHLADRAEKWTESRDVFDAYRIDEQIAKALERKVWLPSGGSLVIDRTEAMTVIDVNTGKFTGQGGNLEETVTRNNLEAAEEIVRQLRLRDVGGIIVVDFIDMVLESNRDLVLRRLLECLARDRTKHQVAEVTSLGLVQMTRKRVGQGLLEAFSEVCECCNGRGIHVSITPVDDKPEKAAAGSRRRKRKGEVERAVERKLAHHETGKERTAEKTAKASTADAKTAEDKAADGKTADGKTGDAKTADRKTGDAKTGDAKTADRKTGKAKSKAKSKTAQAAATAAAAAEDEPAEPSAPAFPEPEAQEPEAQEPVAANAQGTGSGGQASGSAIQWPPAPDAAAAEPGGAVDEDDTATHATAGLAAEDAAEAAIEVTETGPAQLDSIEPVDLDDATADAAEDADDDYTYGVDEDYDTDDTNDDTDDETGIDTDGTGTDVTGGTDDTDDTDEDDEPPVGNGRRRRSRRASTKPS
jgi:ribonuclease E